MNKETNVTDISQKLNLARKNRQKEDGVLFSEGFEADRSSADVPTHIEVYEGNYYLAGNAGLSVTIGGTSTVIILTAREAGELSQALYQAAYNDNII